MKFSDLHHALKLADLVRYYEYASTHLKAEGDKKFSIHAGGAYISITYMDIASIADAYADGYRKELESMGVEDEKQRSEASEANTLEA